MVRDFLILKGQHSNNVSRIEAASAKLNIQVVNEQVRFVGDSGLSEAHMGQD